MKEKRCMKCGKMTYKWQQINSGIIHCYDECRSTHNVHNLNEYIPKNFSYHTLKEMCDLILKKKEQIKLYNLATNNKYKLKKSEVKLFVEQNNLNRKNNKQKPIKYEQVVGFLNKFKGKKLLS